MASLLATGEAAACRAPALENGAHLRLAGTWVAELPTNLADVPGAPFRAFYAVPDESYGHGILGRAADAAELRVVPRASPGQAVGSCGEAPISVPAGRGRVFEDVAPRLTDVDGDGRAEILAVRSDARLGAQLVIYRMAGEQVVELAATPPIGTRHRWLAPAAWGDLDGDGAFEIAYVDRPHLAKVLRVWRLEGGRLREVATLPGVTNHAIGDPRIFGGGQRCPDGYEMVLQSADRTRLVGVTLRDDRLSARDLGPAEAFGTRDVGPRTAPGREVPPCAG